MILNRLKYSAFFPFSPYTHKHTFRVMCLIHSVRRLCFYGAVIPVTLKSSRLVNQTERCEAPRFFFFLFLYFPLLFTSPTQLPICLPPLLPQHVLLQMSRGSRVTIYWCLSLWPAVTVTGLSNQPPLGMATAEMGFAKRENRRNSVEENKSPVQIYSIL